MLISLLFMVNVFFYCSIDQSTTGDASFTGGGTMMLYPSTLLIFNEKLENFKVYDPNCGFYRRFLYLSISAVLYRGMLFPVVFA